jgi:hypothetical protein
MRPTSYLSSITRVGLDSRSPLAPPRILFRPAPLVPGGYSEEAPSTEALQTHVTPAAHIACSKLPAPKGDVNESPEKSTFKRPHRNHFTPSTPLAISGKAPRSEGSSTTVAGAEDRQAARPLNESPEKSVSKGPRRPDFSGEAQRLENPSTVAPGAEERNPVVEQAVGDSATVEPRSEPARDHPPHAALGWAWKTLPAAINEAGNPVHSNAYSPGSHPEPQRGRPKTAEINVEPSAPVLQPPQKPTPALLVPSPPAREQIARTSGAAEKRENTHGNTGAGIRIGSLEVRVVPPFQAVPPASRQMPAPVPRKALSQGFLSFGLTQG